MPDLPYTPGKDGAGVVVAVGPAVEKPAVGDRVYVDGPSSGTLAELVTCAATCAKPLPDNVGFEAGACVGVPAGTAYQALFVRCGVKAGEAVLVHGASGGVGLAAVALAKAAGCVVAGTASTQAGAALAKAAGCDAVGRHGDYKELLEQGLATGALTPAVGARFRGLEQAGAAHVEVIEKAQQAGGNVVMVLDEE